MAEGDVHGFKPHFSKKSPASFPGGRTRRKSLLQFQTAIRNQFSAGTNQRFRSEGKNSRGKKQKPATSDPARTGLGSANNRIRYKSKRARSRRSAFTKGSLALGRRSGR